MISGVAYGGFEVRCEREERKERCLTRKEREKERERWKSGKSFLKCRPVIEIG